MVVGYTTAYAISDYHHERCEFEPRSGDVYSIQHYLLKFVSHLLQVGGFLRFPDPLLWHSQNVKPVSGIPRKVEGAKGVNWSFKLKDT
jgi:hypothetical protein